MTYLVSSTASNVALAVNYQLMKGLLSAARKKLPFYNGTLAGTLEKNGSTAAVKWERIDNLAVATTTLGELTGAQTFPARSTVLPTISTVSATILKKGNAIALSEEIDLMQLNLRAAKFLDTLGANAGESLNALMETIYASATLVRYANGAVGGGTADTNVTAALGINDIKYAVNQLNRNSAMRFTADANGSTNIGTSPVRASYYGITHVDVEEDVRAITGFIPVEQYGGYTETMPFEYGAVGGVRFCSTEIIPVSTGAGTTTATGLRGATAILNDVYSTYIYGKEAVGSVGLGNTHATTAYEMYNPKNPPAVEVIYHKPGSSGALDPYNEVGSLAWKSWWTGALLNANWCVKVRSGASKL
jgi:N4-gp56 family major capsid protein